MSPVNEIKVAALKRELAAGINDLDQGRFQSYNNTSIMRLADDVSRSGRIRLNALRLKVAAKVHGKKKRTGKVVCNFI